MGAAFDALQEFLASILAFFYNLVPSFGLAIVALTILINLLLFPLTLRQTRATRAFQEIQPEVRRLQKKYKDDSATLQQELMKLQKEAGATPGGCLIPLLVQAPIWFALFRVLRDPIEYVPENTQLYDAVAAGGTRFLGMDLATTPEQAMSQGLVTAIPYLLLIVLMVVTQYVQQWHAQPKGQEQSQQQRQMQFVTKAMPLFIGFISYRFPAGLLVYWAVSNLFRLGQQALIFRIDGRPQPSAEGKADEEEPAPAPKPQQPKTRPQGSAKKRKRRRRK